MKNLFLSFIGIFFCSCVCFAQKQSLKELDSLLQKNSTYNFHQSNKNIDLLSAKVFDKKNSIHRNLSNKDFDKYLNQILGDNPLLHNNKMPIYFPEGNFKTRVFEIDTAKSYTLRILVPEFR